MKNYFYNVYPYIALTMLPIWYMAQTFSAYILASLTYVQFFLLVRA